MTDPRKARCFDKAWRYTPANSTDIAKTIARERKRIKEVEAARQAEAASKQAKKSADAKSARIKERA